ncbi:DddA-like double-stranded DNA deaminase toxin [Halosaccharopolyspora lacisalsi]|uniref:DddA-like double-stranded DNA deaminase toxin n=1 Tax=Halosaccharopolyspora lacisalsi TaxID=1000566 RepID=UPI0015FD737F
MRCVRSSAAQEWLTDVGGRISPEAGVHVTTGIGFDVHGSEVGSARSGRDRLAAAVSQHLRDTPRFPSAGSPSGSFASSDHAETKYAMWMRENQVEHLTVVINKDVVCEPPPGCQRAVRAILSRGSSMTVLSSVCGLRWELRGVAPS